jgi:hypothetical protein
LIIAWLQLLFHTADFLRAVSTPHLVIRFEEPSQSEANLGTFYGPCSKLN